MNRIKFSYGLAVIVVLNLSNSLYGQVDCKKIKVDVIPGLTSGRTVKLCCPEGLMMFSLGKGSLNQLGEESFNHFCAISPLEQHLEHRNEGNRYGQRQYGGKKTYGKEKKEQYRGEKKYYGKEKKKQYRGKKYYGYEGKK